MYAADVVRYSAANFKNTRPSLGEPNATESFLDPPQIQITCRTNWSRYSAFVGSITGPLLGYEVLTAFFLEAGFPGVLLFRWTKVGPGLHFLSTIMVSSRDTHLGDVDPRLQQLDADTAGFRSHRRTRGARRPALAGLTV